MNGNPATVERASCSMFLPVWSAVLLVSVATFCTCKGAHRLAADASSPLVLIGYRQHDVGSEDVSLILRLEIREEQEDRRRI